MKRRERTPQVVADAPPPELRLFARGAHDGLRAGRDAYPSRDEWVAARRAWADGHGLSVVDWWVALVEDAQARARTLGEVNEPFSDYLLVEPDEDEDLRVVMA